MGNGKDGQPRGKYTLEFKLEAVRLVKAGQAVANVLGMTFSHRPRPPTGYITPKQVVATAASPPEQSRPQEGAQ